MPLPSVDHEAYWDSYHPAPDTSWAGAMTHIAGELGSELGGLRRAPTGRNIVLIGDEHVVKLIPPFWADMWARECRALELVSDRLDIRTPRLVHCGDAGSWRYVVMERIIGEPLGRRADAIGDMAERCRIARLQGEAAAMIHALAGDDGLAMDWPTVIGEQRDAMSTALSDVAPLLATRAVDFVDAVGDLSVGTGVVLHGDLSAINFLRMAPGELALVDWSDAAVGPVEHDFISPFFHQFRGEPDELDSFWAGYGAVIDPETHAQRIMARGMLKYASLMAAILNDLPGPPPQTWADAARRFCRVPEA